MIRPISKWFPLLLLLLISSTGFGQSIPLNPDVKIGTLKNGFKYYILKNGYPEKRVEFRLVVNAGSMQEDEDQLGLAHFVEHMAFNGSKNFEKNELVDFLQSVGVEFGADLNAYTSFEETVYILPLPTDDDEILDKGYTVLQDWAGGLSFDPEEIDKERGVVTEEWRIGRGAQQRMRDEYFPILFKDSRYADRLPIGTKEIINGAPYETVKRFYTDWYRPDLMALVVVGDIDVAATETEIKKRFGKLKPVKDPRSKISNTIPNHDETYVAITKDKENSFSVVQLIYKQDKQKEETLSDFRGYYLQTLYNIMMGSRLSELTQKADPPFIFGNSSYSGFVRAGDNYSSFAVVGETGFAQGIETLAIENERVKKYGFTPSELDRAIKELESSLEQSLKEKGKTESDRLVGELVRNFLENEPIPGIQFEYDFFKEIAPTIQVNEVNALASKWIKDQDRVVIVMGVDKEGVVLPTEEQVLEALDIKDLAIEPYEDVVSDEGLISSLPPAGTVTTNELIEPVDVSEITLSNGVKIVLKSTDFKNDEILMTAFSYGGHSVCKDEDYISASNASGIINQSGISKFSAIDLNKMLAGKTVQVGPYIGELREGLNGSSSPEDFEIMLQLAHLYFTAPRKDETAFKSLIQRSKQYFQNLMANPQFYYNDKLSRIMTSDHPRGGGFPTPEQMDQIDFDKVHEIFADRFLDPQNFTFFFVGNIDQEIAVPLFEQYLGSLPTVERIEDMVDLGIRPPKNIKKNIYKGEDEKSFVTLSFRDEDDLSPDDAFLLNALGEVISNRLIELLREDESGVYSVNASAGATKYPYPNYRMTVRFPCGPENVDKLIQATLDELNNIKENGVSDEDVKKVAEAKQNDWEENLKNNDWWLRRLSNYYYTKTDLKSYYNFQKRVKDLNAEALRQTAQKYLDLDNFIQVVLYPEPMQKE
ncbi:MAG: insulinase family protein [Cyclobacteriaceae bacterium]|nr:insulinase family protein [Cyclobacteriaceae bacterium HetDA_MAG_MS6]